MPQRLKARLAKLPANSRVVVLTGAGISAESGIPTFRGEEGYWTVGSRNFHPTELATYGAFCEMPDDVWSWYLYRRTVCNRAQPNQGHQALARLEQALEDRCLLITQNVDGLHLRAGNSLARTYQIHGNIDYMRCAQECSTELYPIDDRAGAKERGQGLTAQEVDALVCPRCGGRARPHVLWFDECYDEERFRLYSSLGAANQCAVLVTVGTSGGTNLPNQVAQLAARRGALVVDINPERNPFSRLAESSGGLWLKASAGQGVPEVVELLTGRTP